MIGYGVVQSSAPRLLTRNGNSTDEVLATRQWGFILGVTATALAVLVAIDAARTWVVVIGLIVFGVVFAMNSALHSFLVLAYSNDDGVALDVGFYYSANAAGRLVGTLLSGLLFLAGGLIVALVGCAVFVVLTWMLTLRLPALPDGTHASLASVKASD